MTRQSQEVERLKTAIKVLRDRANDFEKAIGTIGSGELTETKINFVDVVFSLAAQANVFYLAAKDKDIAVP
jgi:hypothetical protein